VTVSLTDDPDAKAIDAQAFTVPALLTDDTIGKDSDGSGSGSTTGGLLLLLAAGLFSRRRQA